MNQPLKTISIGIPVYNEAGNIKQLLQALLSQKITSVQLQEIIVVADAPTDDTLLKIKEVSSSLIRVIVLPQRQGLANAQNILTKQAQGDILIIMDGDVQPADDQFIEHIVQPILSNPSVGLVGAAVIPNTPHGFFEKAIVVGHHLRNNIFMNINRGNNIYLSHGCTRAFSKAFYQKISWPAQFAEDAYSYLLCLDQGFTFVLALKAAVVLKSPSVIRDYLKQSLRFVDGKKGLAVNFPAGTVKKAYHIPVSTVLPEFVRALARHPIALLCYMGIMAYSRLLSFTSPTINHTFIDPPLSTKTMSR